MLNPKVADSEVIADQLSKMGGYDVYGLVEVLPQDLGRFRDALGKNYKYAYSKSGNNDRLQLLYNEGRFELVRQLELDDINFEMRYRSPLLIHLRDRATKSEFMVMVNHLARGKEEVRTRQAEQLVEWARGQTLPIFAIGDYNFDLCICHRNRKRRFSNDAQGQYLAVDQARSTG